MRDDRPQWETEAAERREELLLQRAKQSLNVGQNAVPPLSTLPCPKSILIAGFLKLEWTSQSPRGVLVVVQWLSCVWLFVTPWTAVCQASLSFTISQSLLKFMSIESVMPSNHLILCHPLLLLPAIFPSIRVFSNESVLLIRWPKYWSFSISPSNGYSWLISFRIDWFDLLAVQRTLKSLLQHHNLKTYICF